MYWLNTMRNRQKRKRENTTTQGSAKKIKRTVGRQYNPLKKYVYAGIFGPADIITDLSAEEIQKGLTADKIITLDTHNQRQLVDELNGKALSMEVLANAKKRNKLLKNRKAVTITTWRNRQSALRFKSIIKIMDDTQAWEAAIKLTPRLPFPSHVANDYFYVQEALMKELLALPASVLNKMGIEKIHASRIQHEDDLYIVHIRDLNRYNKWRLDHGSPPVDKTVGAEQFEKTGENMSSVSADTVMENMATPLPVTFHLPIYSIFADSSQVVDKPDERPQPSQDRARTNTIETVAAHDSPSLLQVTSLFRCPSPPCSTDAFLSPYSSPLNNESWSEFLDLDDDWQTKITFK